MRGWTERPDRSQSHFATLILSRLAGRRSLEVNVLCAWIAAGWVVGLQPLQALLPSLQRMIDHPRRAMDPVSAVSRLPRCSSRSPHSPECHVTRSRLTRPYPTGPRPSARHARVGRGGQSAPSVRAPSPEHSPALPCTSSLTCKTARCPDWWCSLWCKTAALTRGAVWCSLARFGAQQGVSLPGWEHNGGTIVGVGLPQRHIHEGRELEATRPCDA